MKYLSFGMLLTGVFIVSLHGPMPVMFAGGCLIGTAWGMDRKTIWG